MDRRLWYLIAGTRGGINRARILWSLRNRPHNANDLAEFLGLDYKTVRHHLDILRE
ncbi:MAG: winged helix-turn-helix domain-containing protein, partial [Candidatus Thermoplasmatota archaeon]